MDPFPSRAEPRLVAEPAPGDNAPALSVSELSGALKRTVEDRFGHVRVRGEISGFKRAASGHCYLCLKDEAAVIDGVVWKGAAAAMRFRPEDGIEVVATGKLTTYPGRSKYQIVIERMEIAGAGALMALLDQRRRQLAAEGLFDQDRKRPLPFLPRVIGVVTSPTGAVIRDILHRLADRFPSRVIVWPVPVQGEGAAEQVAAAVRGFGALAEDGPVPRPDLLIVARGGGSIEDLWAFNEEAVVRAVAASPIPVVSAVGHETDTSLCDFAADLRAPTPTAAAELAVPVRGELLAQVAGFGARAERCARRYRDHAADKLGVVARRLPAPEALFSAQRQRVDDLADRLPRALRSRLAHARSDLAHAAGALRPRLLQAEAARARTRLDAVGRDLGRAGEHALAGQRRRFDAVRLRPELLRGPLAQAQDRLDRIGRLLETLHPLAPLKRGYAKVERRDGSVVGTAAAARAAGALTVRFADGAVDAKVERARGRAYDEPQAQGSLL